MSPSRLQQILERGDVGGSCKEKPAPRRGFGFGFSSKLRGSPVSVAAYGMPEGMEGQGWLMQLRGHPKCKILAARGKCNFT